jgi:hypothetical protein
MRTIRHRGLVFTLGILVLAGFLSLSCSKEPVEFTAAPFTFDAARVDSLRPAADMDLSFAPPLGWRNFDSTALDYFGKMLARMELAVEFYPVFPVAGAIDSVTQSIMFIAEIEEAEAAIASMADDYEEYLNERIKEGGMERTAYRINDLEVHSYLLHSQEAVNYKLIGETPAGKRFLIEYVVRAPLYPTLEPTISSSIASLRSAPTMPVDR